MQIISSLVEEKEKLTNEFNETRSKYKSEMRRIDTALRKFRQGVDALSSDSPMPRKNKITATSEIEKIIAEFGQSKIKDITARLHLRGFNQTTEQTVSGILQRNAKAGQRFVKVAPATYALLEKTKVATATEEDVQLTVVYEDKLVGGNDESE